MAKSTVAVKFTGDASHLQGTIGKVESSLGGLGRAASTAGKVVAVGLGAGIVGGVALGKQVLDLGAKLTAWRQKTATVFEGSAADIRAWADKNNETFGLTDDELAGLAASFGDLLKPMGFTSDQAAAMAKDVVGLSGALSEWSGGTRTAAEVSNILSKAMLGERDGLKELGISITEADVSARLATKGQEKLTGAALEQAKAIATQELIFEKSTDAQKAYAEGGNKALRASNKLKAGFAELKERIASGLLPIVIDLAEKFGKKVMPVLEEVAGGISAFAGAFKAADGDITSSGFPGFMEKLAFQARQAFDQISAKVKEWGPKVVAAFKAIVGFVQKNWPAIQKIVKNVMETVRQVIAGVVSVITTLWNNFGDNILDLVKRVWPRVQQVIEGAMKIIQGVIKTITSLIKGDWSQVWEGIKQIVSGVWTAIQGIVGTALEVLRSAIGVGLEVIGSVFKSAWEGITEIAKSAVRGIVDVFLGMAETIVGAAASAFSWVPGLGGKLREAEEAIRRFRDEVNEALGGIQDKVVAVRFVRSDFIGPLPTGTERLPAGFIGPVPVGRNAAGTNDWRGGLTWVGERGKELINLPKGSQVFSHAQSMQMARGGGAEPIHVTVTLDGRVLGEVLANRAAVDNRNRAN